MAKILQMWNADTYSLPTDGADLTVMPGWGVSVADGKTVPAEPGHSFAFIIIPRISDGAVYKGYKSSAFEAIYGPIAIEVHGGDVATGSSISDMASVGDMVTFSGGKWRSTSGLAAGSYSFGEVIQTKAASVVVYFRGTGRSKVVTNS